MITRRLRGVRLDVAMHEFMNGLCQRSLRIEGDAGPPSAQPADGSITSVQLYRLQRSVRSTEYLGHRRWRLIIPETLTKQPVGTLPAQDF